MVLGLIFAVVLAKGSVLKALAMILTGLLLSMVGSDLETGAGAHDLRHPGTVRRHRLRHRRAWACSASPKSSATWRIPAEPRDRAGQGHRPDADPPDLKASAGAIGRGTVIGSLLGILPGGGAVIASFAAYTLEKKISKHPERFGRGAIEGVAAPESANNAAAQTSFIPLLTLGIPPNAVMALMVGAMTIHGIVPGPQVMTKQPELFWGMIASMWLGNLMLVIINLPLVGMWVTPAAGAVPPAVSVDRHLLLHRRLFDQQLADRRDR